MTSSNGKGERAGLSNGIRRLTEWPSPRGRLPFCCENFFFFTIFFSIFQRKTSSAACWRRNFPLFFVSWLFFFCVWCRPPILSRSLPGSLDFNSCVTGFYWVSLFSLPKTKSTKENVDTQRYSRICSGANTQKKTSVPSFLCWESEKSRNEKEIKKKSRKCIFIYLKKKKRKWDVAFRTSRWRNNSDPSRVPWRRESINFDDFFDHSIAIVYRVFPGLNWVEHCAVFYRVLLGFTGFYLALLGFTEF